MKWRSVEEMAAAWGVSARQVRGYCAKGRVAGASFEGGAWRIPEGAEKPARKSRRRGEPKDILAILEAERKAKLPGGLYHRLQIDFTYNSNHMEGSRLTREQTRWIFETRTLGDIGADVPVDDIVETANHFRAVDTVIATARAALTERYVKRLHAILKGGTADSRNDWFAVGDYKRLENVVGERETAAPARVGEEMARLLAWYAGTGHGFEDVAEFHVRFETIHPFQDGNGRVGRLVMLKECLKHGITPILVTEETRRFYYKGLQEWQGRERSRARLLDTFRAGQDVFAALLRKYGHAAAADAADARDGRDGWGIGGTANFPQVWGKGGRGRATKTGNQDGGNAR